MSVELNRREFVTRGGYVVGAIFASASWPTSVTTAQAVPGASAAPFADAYVGVVTAVGEPSGSMIDSSRADEALVRFGDFYADQIGDTKQAIRLVFNALDDASAGRAFRRRDRPSRRRLLKAWLDEAGDSRRGPARPEPATLEDYLRAHADDAPGGLTAAGCDAEADGPCPPSTAVPAIPESPRPGPAPLPRGPILRAYFAGVAVTLAGQPFIANPKSDFVS